MRNLLGIEWAGILLAASTCAMAQTSLPPTWGNTGSAVNTPFKAAQPLATPAQPAPAQPANAPAAAAQPVPQPAGLPEASAPVVIAVPVTVQPVPAPAMQPEQPQPVLPQPLPPQPVSPPPAPQPATSSPVQAASQPTDSAPVPQPAYSAPVQALPQPTYSAPAQPVYSAPAAQPSYVPPPAYVPPAQPVHSQPAYQAAPPPPQPVYIPPMPQPAQQQAPYAPPVQQNAPQDSQPVYQAAPPPPQPVYIPPMPQPAQQQAPVAVLPPLDGPYKSDRKKAKHKGDQQAGPVPNGPGNGPWIDISAPLAPAVTPVYEGNPPLVVKFTMDMENGDALDLSQIDMGTHTGTHVDAPLHFVRGAPSIDEVPLDRLIGPALVIDVDPRVIAITAAELEKYPWRGHQRILFRTRNSVNSWIIDPHFHRDFTFLAPDAAQLLADNGVLLVGIDYLSIEQFGAYKPRTHQILLGRGIPIVEGLDLRTVIPGEYDFMVLPLKILGHEAAPGRAALRAR